MLESNERSSLNSLSTHQAVTPQHQGNVMMQNLLAVKMDSTIIGPHNSILNTLMAEARD